MLFSKPLTAGLVLITLSAVTQGRVVQLPNQDGHDIAQRGLLGAATIDQTFAISESDTTLDPRSDKRAKRAPPRITRPGREDGGTGQDGSGAQTGGGTQEGGGTQTGGDTQTGGNRQDGSDAPGAPVADPAPAPAAPAGVQAIPAYADLPPNFNAPNRVPGQDVLPNEIPAQRGLSTSAEDAPIRASFQRFVNWDIQSSNLVGRDSHYLFYVGDKARNTRLDFRNEFNGQNLHKEGLDANDKNRLIDNTDIYTGLAIGDDKVPQPPHKPGATGADNWMGMLESYGTAKRAAARGGIVRVLVDEKPGTNTPNRDRLNQEGSYFYNFELATLTAPGTRIQSIRAYGAKEDNGVSSFTPSQEIWSAGQPQMGKTPDWIEGTKPVDQRTGVPEEDDLIDLGDFRKLA